MFQYSTTEVKRKSRAIILDFARRHMPRYDPEDIRMLCLAGIDCADIYEISRPLRIPDRQVTIVERDLDVFEQIEKKKKEGKIECNLYYGELADYLERTNEKFRFVSLDYTGQLTLEKMDELFIIFDRQLLNSHSILHTNFYGKMERKAVQEVYRDIVRYRGREKGYPFSEKVNQMTLQKIRDEVITEYLINEAQSGTYTLPKSLLQNALASSIYKKAIQYIAQVTRPEDLKYMRGPTRAAISKFDENFIPLLTQKLGAIAKLIYIGQIQKPYYPIYFERYEYHGPKGAHMYTDLFEFDQRRKIFDNLPVKLVWNSQSIDFVGDVPIDTVSGWQFSDSESYKKFAFLANWDEFFNQRFFDDNFNPTFKKRKLIK
jgi:hypothetical protein